MCSCQNWSKSYAQTINFKRPNEGVVEVDQDPTGNAYLFHLQEMCELKHSHNMFTIRMSLTSIMSNKLSVLIVYCLGLNFSTFIVWQRYWPEVRFA